MAVLQTIDPGNCSGLDLLQTSGDLTPIITLDTVKSFIRVDFADDDAILAILLNAAIEEVEMYCQISLRAKAYTATYDTVSSSFELPYGPVTAVILCADSTGSPLTYTITSSPFAKIMIAGGGVGTVTIKYTTGYATGVLPNSILLAIMKIVSTAYDMRADFEVIRGSLIEYSNDSKNLLSPYRRKIMF